MKTLILPLIVAAVLLAGCGDTGTHIMITESALTAASTTPAAPASTASASAPSQVYPVVHFSVSYTGSDAAWPFTAQIASISTSPSGFTGGAPAEPTSTYLTVQVNITSLITDRPVQPPGVVIRCHAPGDGSWKLKDTQAGYDEGSQAPSASGYNVPMNDGQPHPWDVEWEVPAGTGTSNVKCVLVQDSGNLKLN
ncbi:MAG TPA: hypothetical protein VFY36_03625 [Solirubrobacteraceae bacterium]|nr:hypothetical protein [Solirubrobacteraceae bacterium]